MKYQLLAIATVSLIGLGAIGVGMNKATADAPVSIAQATPAAPPEGDRLHRRIDFAAAASQLGTTEANLRTALGLPAQRPERPRPDLSAAASSLGVTEEQLRTALGITIDPQTNLPVRPRTRPDLAAAATQLNVTEERLRTALGLPDRPPTGERPPRPQLDIAGAATRLGVTQEQVIRALGIEAPTDTNQPQ
ncbi:hypothetical protein H6F67_18830 [Microcoleus sp. FACHB-1515]|nr:hypothetical protein [Microcoleus sp. FACHB-1515]